jgi:hypothetical protein
MAPERRRRLRDLRGELLVGALDVLPKVKAGNVCAPAAVERVGDVSEDEEKSNSGCSLLPIASAAARRASSYAPSSLAARAEYLEAAAGRHPPRGYPCLRRSTKAPMSPTLS